jgi:hypothetical protein
MACAAISTGAIATMTTASRIFMTVPHDQKADPIRACPSERSAVDGRFYHGCICLYGGYGIEAARTMLFVGYGRACPGYLV